MPNGLPAKLRLEPPKTKVHSGLGRCLVAGLLLPLIAAPAIGGQIAGPKTDFVQALAQFSLGLEGAYGDEGIRIRSSLNSMDLELERWDATIRTYETAMASEVSGATPQVAARLHAALGGVYLDRSRVADALREFAAATALDPGHAEAYALQGVAYSHPLANDGAAAAAALRQASSLDPREPVRTYLLGRQLLKIGELEEARKALRLFEERESVRVADQGGKAVSSPFIRLGLAPEQANVEPFFPPALYAEGFALLERGDYSRAILQFREAATRDPLMADTVETREEMGQAATAFRSGLVQIAIHHLEAAIELAPTRAEPHRILGRVYLANQQYDSGVNELRTAVRLSPGDERARLVLADALVDTGRDPEAEQTLRATIEAVPASGQAHYSLGRLYQRQGQYPQALREFEKAVTFGPLLGLNGLYKIIGALNVDQQNFDAAIDAYARRVDVHPNDAAAHQDLGRIYARLGRHDEARAEFAVVLLLNPDHVDAYAALAQVHLTDRQYVQAAETARRALALDPAHEQARYTLATSLIRLGRTEEGRQELELFQHVQDEAAAARSRQIELDQLRGDAVVSAADGDHEKAIALLRKALQSAPGAASSHLDLGLALAKAGQHAEAIERFKSAIALDAHFDVHRHLAESYAALGQLEESRKEQAIYERLKQESLGRAGANR
jgi:tetratricopeptide (TPR) repeat protein